MSILEIQLNQKLVFNSETEFEKKYVLKDVENSIFFENKLCPAYPMQTWSWAADFWLDEKENVNGHKAYLVNINDESEMIWLQAVVYQYPWHFGEVFLTIPRGPVSGFGFSKASQESQNNLIALFKSELEKLVEKTQAAFIKIESTWDGSQVLDLKTGETDHDIAALDYNISQSLYNLFEKGKTTIKTKFLQPPYSRTIKIQVNQNADLNSESSSFQDFYNKYFEDVVSSFESKTRYNARLSRKKGLEVIWDKSELGFEEFWKIMEKTSDRQEFVPYTRSYYAKVLKNDWADLVLVKTPEGEVTNAWMGSFCAGMGMYLYGGSDIQFSSLKGAELIHTAAIIRTLQKCGKLVENESKEKVLELIYDMGGSSLLDGALPAWDGYSKFKKGFGGKIVEYLPHTYDIIYKSGKYNSVNFMIQKVKPLIKKIKQSLKRKRS